MIVKTIFIYRGHASCDCIIYPGTYGFRTLIHYWFWYLKKTLVEGKKVVVLE